MYDLARLSLQDVTEIGIALRSLGKNSDSLETVANRCVQYFYQNLIDPITGQSACTLVRLFKTHAYADLPAELQSCETRLDDADQSTDELKCLTLLGTAGDQFEWQNRRRSKGHQVIPLTSEEAVQKIPMISQLITAFGFKTRYVFSA